MEALSTLFVAILILLILIWKRKNRNKNTLPGPLGLPIVGYIPFMTNKPYEILTNLAKIYGPVYSLPLGSKRIAVITDFKLLKKAFSSDIFIGKPPDLPFELHEESMRTEAFIGMPWKEQRQFSLKIFRDLGFGKTRMEEFIKEEILDLIDCMSKNKTVFMFDLLYPSISNNVAILLFGNRMKPDDPKRLELTKLLSDISKLAGPISWHIFFPWIRSIMKYFTIGNQGKLIKAIQDTLQFIRKEIVEHENTLDPNNTRDFLDLYLLEIHKRTSNPNTTFKREVLADLVRGFFGAGSETVCTAVEWMLLLCAAFPDVQQKIHREIDAVLGRDTFPTGSDRPRMPYTEAAICETMRWKTTMPIIGMRYTIEDTELNGYFIPKHTDVSGVLWAMNHDETLWGNDVSVYRPERFLSPDKQKCLKPEYFIPFSIGKRQCPGKVFAEAEVFLYIAAILQKFEFKMPQGVQADLEGNLAILLHPKKQELCIRVR